MMLVFHMGTRGHEGTARDGTGVFFPLQVECVSVCLEGQYGERFPFVCRGMGIRREGVKPFGRRETTGRLGFLVVREGTESYIFCGTRRGGKLSVNGSEAGWEISREHSWEHRRGERSGMFGNTIGTAGSLSRSLLRRLWNRSATRHRILATSRTS